MAVSTKIIKRRIKSVKNTKKITKAMELVSAAKMRRAVEAVVNTRSYSSLAWELLMHLSAIREQVSLPLLEMRPVQRLLVILMTSNRGLCGSFNTNIIRKTLEQLKNPKNIARHRDGGKELEPAEQVEVSVIAVGKKGGDRVAKLGYRLEAVFSEVSDTPRLDDIMPIVKMVRSGYEEKQYDKVVIAYTDFRSAVTQVPKLRQLLPLSTVDLEKMLLDAGVEEVKNGASEIEYLFEPDKLDVLQMMLPRLVETQLFQAILESSASEHSARMIAMRSASDAAEEMVDELNLSFNKARQAGITQQIAEIAGGAAALG
ncbi:MAG: ATP synthase F1 subunit gamma [Patescibacteria group bacterium]